MIPAFNQSGVLPPYLPGSSPTDPLAVSPYETTMLEIVQRYGTTAVRREHLNGLLGMRAALRGVGVRDAFQWVNGSFSEDIEATEQRDPGDIDVVTFGRLPTGLSGLSAFNAYPEIFNPVRSKDTYSCDAYFVDLALPAEAIHLHTCYWLGLFSHKRVSNLWKGMLKVALGADDTAAQNALGGLP
jgi:hypothetical protein